MLSRSLTRTYQVPVSALTTWNYLSDPASVAAASHHRVLVNKPDPGFTVGTRWEEIHDDECDFDTVPWVVTACTPLTSFTIQGLQSGARQRATTSLRAIPGGTEVTATLKLSPSLKAHGTVFERLVVVMICFSGLGMSVVADAFEQAIADDRDHLSELPAGVPAIDGDD